MTDKMKNETVKEPVSAGGENITVLSSSDNKNTSSETNNGNENNNDKKYTKDDLIDLIRAIKFSNPNASIRNVHDEITTKMAKNDSFEFLENVKLNDVKKVWKKAISSPTPTQTPTSASTKSDVAQDVTECLKNDLSIAGKKKKGRNGKEKEEIIKFYTVGDGSVKTLANKYTLQAAAQAAAHEEALKSEEKDDLQKNYVSCFLDVPLDCSGKRPHQALVNFNDHKKQKAKKSNNSAASDGKDIVKIQVAAPLPGVDSSPMLLYNADRSAKTFIHPDDDDDNGGYDKINELIRTDGVSGALRGGGNKAYFYSFITRRKDDQDLISIDVSKLAPMQKW